MNPTDAQSSLDDIRRLQGKTHDEIVRHNFTLPYVLLGAVGLLIGFGGTDLDNSWRTLSMVLGFGLFVGVAIVHERRASARMKGSLPLLGLQSAISAGVLLVYIVFRIASWALFGLPAHGLLSQGMAGGVAATVAYVLATPLTRRAHLAIMRHDARRG
ncbi:hypothetical protein [Nonomuraea zeae]|uniref:Uncharacterized protein n=1 Tax=Nonomuraea zeae TaxID=1642303 RepID=A0A5S4GTQ2_9ACTN|nr:hypothetical protein [Nonomuraea zeae]TMR36219.1 hypothetical protein ETD85_11470 [Nonomuraea zeae]